LLTVRFNFSWFVLFVWHANIQFWVKMQTSQCVIQLSHNSGAVRLSFGGNNGVVMLRKQHESFTSHLRKTDTVYIIFSPRFRL